MEGMKIQESATVWTGKPLADGTPLLVVMHGFGANEHDLVPIVSYLPDHFAAACIQAPMPLPMMPGGFAWFPITQNPGTPDLHQADAAVTAVLDWLEGVTAGITPGPIVLLGFSQGGAMVTHLLRTAPERFAAGVVLSGFIVPAQVPGDGELARVRPPVFLGYDPADSVVPGAAFERTRQFGEEHFTLTSQTYRIGHGINDQELLDVRAFLAGVLDDQ